MYSSHSPTEIRQLVLVTLSRLRSVVTAAADIEEVLLIQDGTYMGRSYRTDDYMAMWMPSIELIQFYDEEGNLAHSINLTTPPADQLQAA
ncbi:MAG: hypothetical protein MI757_21040 [Pirellulales bacterium]|nr:hypothetical protein [Pirellulales bacterium]